MVSFRVTGRFRDASCRSTRDENLLPHQATPSFCQSENVTAGPFSGSCPKRSRQFASEDSTRRGKPCSGEKSTAKWIEQFVSGRVARPVLRTEQAATSSPHVSGDCERPQLRALLDAGK